MDHNSELLSTFFFSPNEEYLKVVDQRISLVSSHRFLHFPLNRSVIIGAIEKKEKILDFSREKVTEIAARYDRKFFQYSQCEETKLRLRLEYAHGTVSLFERTSDFKDEFVS